MKIEKELKDISWQVPESTYRADPALSYTTLSTYEREGFNNLDHLFDKKETPSLLLGSCVDSIITGGKEEFDSRFYVADFPSVGEKELKVVKSLFSKYGNEYVSMSLIPGDLILQEADAFTFQTNWRWDTRIRVLTERCANYYNLLYLAGDKTIVSAEMYNDVCKSVEALKTSNATAGYFADNQESSPIRRYYQLKFKANLHLNPEDPVVTYRVMADNLVVDYEDKKIIPIDLKTSSHKEWDFQDSFTQWNYMIQARLYWRIIRANMNKDPYFKDFTLENYRFIVVNKDTLTPLVWEFPLTKAVGTLVDDEGHEYRDPCVIGQELRGYLDLRPTVPNGIDKNGINTITKLKLKE